MIAFDAMDLATWPIVLSLAEMSLIYQIPESVIVQAVKAGMFRPAPLDVGLRWSKVHVIEDLQTRPFRTIPFPVRSRTIKNPSEH